MSDNMQARLPVGLRNADPIPSKPNFAKFFQTQAETLNPPVIPKLIEPALKNPASNVPVLLNDTITNQLVIPESTMIPPRASLAEGFLELAKSQEAWNDIQALISANTLIQNNKLGGLPEIFKNTELGAFLKNFNPDTVPPPNPAPQVPPFFPQYGSGVGKLFGHIPFGKFEIDRKKLVRDHQLSLRYMISKKKVNGIPNKKVSEAFVNNVIHLSKNEPIEETLSPDEQRLFHFMVLKSDADLPQIRSLNLDRDSMSLKQLYTMLAQIDAGNTSLKMLKDIESLKVHLEKQGHISKELAKQIQDAYL